MKKKKVLILIICIVICLVGIAFKITSENNKVKVRQTEDTLTIKVNSKDYKSKMANIFSTNLYLVWSEFNELPEDDYKSTVEYEGQAYGVNSYDNGSNNLLTVIYYYDGVYLSTNYLRYEYKDGTLVLQYVDNSGKFSDVKLQIVILNYLKSQGIGED